MAVHVDLISTGVLREGPDGFEQTIVYRVRGVNGDEYSKRWNAIRQSGIPRVGQRHRALPQMRVIERSAESVGNEPATFDVVVQFAEPQAGVAEAIDRTKRYGPITWRGAGRSISRTTNLDINGKPMAVIYEGAPRLDEINLSTGVVNTATFGEHLRTAEVTSVQVDEPLLALSASRWERDNPESKARRFGAKVNRDNWRGYPPLTVLANVMTFDVDPEGGWRVTYEFTYNPREWRVEAAVHIGGQVPQDARVGNGIDYFHVYERESFARWNLT